MKDGKVERNGETERKSGVTEERKRNEIKTKESIKRMKEMGLSDEQICKILNLTIDELKKLM